MARDILKIEVLEDGTIKTTTDPISDANHQNAEDFLNFMARLAGGETTREHRHEGEEHSHVHHHHHEKQN